MSRLITYKGITHERTIDAPFIGALILAPTCENNCPGCFNQYLKGVDNLHKSCDQLIEEVLDDPFNQGIILGGLEWTESPKEMLALIDEAQSWLLQVMVYTHLTEEEFLHRFKQLKGSGIYCKFGEYKQELAGQHISMDIPLATTNQYIKKI